MLSDAQKAVIRAAQQKTFVDTCVIERSSKIPDMKGGSVEVWTPIFTIPCRFAPVTQTQRGSDGVLRLVSETIITVDLDTDVTVKDRIRYNGKTYSITGFKDHSFSTAKRCAVQQI